MSELNTTTEVMNNLAESEAKLGELNNRLADIQQEYDSVVANADIYTFFSFNNIYFWIVLIGLVLLAFGLLFLLIELSHPEARRPKDKYHIPSQKKYKKSKTTTKPDTKRVKKSTKETKAVTRPRKTGKKPVKVKVVKVK